MQNKITKKSFFFLNDAGKLAKTCVKKITYCSDIVVDSLITLMIKHIKINFLVKISV